MKEVKNPKKPLAYYYSITLIALLLFNIFVAPLLNRQHVEQTDYSTFMRMIAEKKIGKVDVSDTEIIFTDKDDNTIYVTGVMYDPTLTQRLYDSGAEFAKDIEQTMSPVLSYLYYDSYKIDIESVDPSKDLSMREVYGLDPAMAK